MKWTAWTRDGTTTKEEERRGKRSPGAAAAVAAVELDGPDYYERATHTRTHTTVRERESETKRVGEERERRSLATAPC